MRQQTKGHKTVKGRSRMPAQKEFAALVEKTGCRNTLEEIRELAHRLKRLLMHRESKLGGESRRPQHAQRVVGETLVRAEGRAQHPSTVEGLEQRLDPPAAAVGALREADLHLDVEGARGEVVGEAGGIGEQLAVREGDDVVVPPGEDPGPVGPVAVGEARRLDGVERLLDLAFGHPRFGELLAHLLGVLLPLLEDADQIAAGDFATVFRGKDLERGGLGRPREGVGVLAQVERAVGPGAAARARMGAAFCEATTMACS